MRQFCTTLRLDRSIGGDRLPHSDFLFLTKNVIFLSGLQPIASILMHKPLEQFHDELNQLFSKACQDYQSGRLHAAGESYLRLLDYFAEAPILHYNLGLVYFGQEEYARARDSFARADELQPGDADILFNLALSKKKSGDGPGAIVTYKQVLELEPMNVDTLYNLACCYKDNSQQTLAIKTYREVLRLVPYHSSANSNLAFLYHLAGNIDLAVQHYRMVLEVNPDHQAAQHMVAALTGAMATHSPDDYVKTIFDNYSEYFEQSLVKELEYCVPGSLRKCLDTAFPGRRFKRGLDLGCGTGLSGQSFIDIIDVLDGLDLSEKMIALACKKNIYHSLHPVSIVEYLLKVENTYDFFLAADVLGYVGELQETFRLLRQKAGSEALFLFSTEMTEGNSYCLRKTGRFAHSPGYVQEVAKMTGWQVAARKETALRKEMGVWVQGHLWLLQLACSD